ECVLALSIILSDIPPLTNLAGLSIPKLIIIFSLIGIVALLVSIMLGYWRGKPWAQQLNRVLIRLFTGDKAYWTIIILSGAGLVLSLNLLLAHRSLVHSGVENLFIAPYLEFMRPFVWVAFLTAIQVPIAVRLLRYGSDVSIFRQFRPAFKFVLASLLILVLLAIILGATDLGLKPDAVGWGTPGVPILSIQVLMVLVFLAAVWYLTRIVLSALHQSTRWNAERIPAWSGDLLISILLWGSAVLIWGAQPIKPTYFSPTPIAPNFEIYPNSDSVHYALDAVKLLIGSGFDSDAIRPLYVMYLALAQAVSGLEYQAVVMWQVLIYAAIPVLIYFLGKSLHHRFTGVLVGILLILRERNALTLAGEINTAHAKLIMADLPITLLVIAYTLIIVRWLQDPVSRKLHPVLAGGVLALAMLIRVQVGVLLPVTLLIVLVYFWRNSSMWLKNGFLLIASTLVVLSPWILRT
ncbi:MAG: hypothetical protein KAT29_08330, partial [Anaerolineales bacterium]|nr:hypothetical protein [Anaerolineales bacterium]